MTFKRAADCWCCALAAAVEGVPDAASGGGRARAAASSLPRAAPRRRRHAPLLRAPVRSPRLAALRAGRAPPPPAARGRHAPPAGARPRAHVQVRHAGGWRAIADGYR